MNTDHGTSASGDRAPGNFGGGIGVGTVVAAPTHRAVSAPSGTGGAPGGAARRANVWSVAWRLQRVQVAVVVAIAVVAGGALAVFRWRITATFQEFGCELFPTDPNGPGCVDATGAQIWWNHGFSSTSSLAHFGMVAGPVMLGAFAAAPLFTREFSRGTHVLALTQSVGRRLWFVAKTTVMIVPLALAMLALGVVMQWTDGVVGITAYGALGQGIFFAHGIIPAAVALVVYALTIAIGMLTRGLLPALVTGILVGGVLLYGLAFAQPHLLPANRTVQTMAEVFPVVTRSMIDAENAQATETHVVEPVDRNQLFVGRGYLDTAGGTVHLSNNTVGACYNGSDAAGRAAAKAAGQSEDSNGNFDMNTPAYRTAVNESTRTCFENAGVVAQYVDILPGSMLWPLRWVMTGICVLLAALFLGVAAWRLPRAVAKR